MPPSDNKEVVDAIRALQADLDTRHTENIGKQAEIDQKIGAISDRLDQVLTSAFPDGDADSHRLYHESLIKRNLAREHLWNEVRAKLITHGLLAAAGVLMLALMHYASTTLQKP
ncbi:hypothetical protein QYH69_34000 [Paraburkholderia sp. SARCC-3016]|uniref:hypothetical protein n=1 Tax=Paraburkholderia sp. SARCC-3016 TaxID=3058611 RepID=UPI002806B422|nr:hypothetical protein [Paraburkholderia sp. SARCC-3016]MDQ7982239.1 hypothetical protein [Paraburkholderia sp. SARCC-3016]